MTSSFSFLKIGGYPNRSSALSSLSSVGASGAVFGLMGGYGKYARMLKSASPLSHYWSSGLSNRQAYTLKAMLE